MSVACSSDVRHSFVSLLRAQSHSAATTPAYEPITHASTTGTTHSANGGADHATRYDAGKSITALHANSHPLPTVPSPPDRFYIYFIAYKRVVHTLVTLFSVPPLGTLRATLQLGSIYIRLMS